MAASDKSSVSEADVATIIRRVGMTPADVERRLTETTNSASVSKP